MQKRGTLLAAAAATAGAVAACSIGKGKYRYGSRVRDTWRHSQESSHPGLGLTRNLVRYATLAPSSHNTQCWKFRLGTDWISIQPDLSRRCSIVDPDDHHLVVSLGCAVENLVQAALAHGFHAQVEQENGGDAIRIALEPTRANATTLFQAIPERQNSRAEYDGKPVAPAILRKLEDVAREDGVELILLTDRRAMREVRDIVLDANAMQVNDPAFVEELKSWTRFGYDEFVEAGDGLFSRCVGSPALPRWLGSKIFGMVFTAEKENKKYAAQVKSSAGMAIFLSPGQDRAQWVKVGRSYERFALEATARDVRTAFLNQPVEVADVRPQFASYLRVGDLRPDLIVRFGHGPHMPRSLRRPLEDVIG